MSIRNLFMKIFLWFWLANTVVIAALAVAIWMYPYVWKSGPLKYDFEQAEKMRTAFEALDQRGVTALTEETKKLNQTSMFRSYFIDEQGTELTGRKVPDALMRYATEHRDQTLRGEPAMTGPPSGYIVMPLRDAKGYRFRGLAEFKGFEADRADGKREPGPGGGQRRGPGPDRSSYFQFSAEPRILLPRLFAIMLAAGLGCYALARYLTSPVRRLQHAVRQLASGDLSARVGNRLGARRDEIGELGRDFDRMAQQVESLVNTQNRLLRDVSHELRSPLARLNVALELAGRDAGSAAAPALGRASRESDRLNELIGQLLTLARLEGGAMQPQQTTIDLKTMVSDIIADADFEAAARDRHVRMVRSVKCSTIGTPELLHSAIENVMRNAVLYTAEGSEVEVSLSCEESNAGKTALLEIRDHGPGVPPGSLEDIFRAFHRVSDARDRRTGGVGLGLAITERAVRLHGGSVRALNAAGGGADRSNHASMPRCGLLIQLHKSCVCNMLSSD
jgi:two-component system sensor histidine kinase CpxA